MYLCNVFLTYDMYFVFYCVLPRQSMIFEVYDIRVHIDTMFIIIDRKLATV